MDNEEFRNLAFGMAGATLQREKVVPEVYNFTFAILVGLENISKAIGEFDGAERFLAALLAAATKFFILFYLRQKCMDYRNLVQIIFTFQYCIFFNWPNLMENLFSKYF